MTPPIPIAGTALLMIDVQNAFLDEHGMSARLAGGRLDAPLTATIEPARQAIAAARAAGVPIIYTQHQFQPDFRDAGFIVEEMYATMFPDNPAAADEVGTLVAGSWEAEILPVLAPAAEDHIVPKNRYDAFLGTSLEQLLTRLGIQTLVVGGVVTTACVESTVRDAAMRDYRVFLVGDAIGDREAVHADGLARLARGFGHLVSAADVVNEWAPATVPAPV